MNLSDFVKLKMRQLDDLIEEPGRNGVTKLGAIRLQLEVVGALARGVRKAADESDKELDGMSPAEQAKMLRAAAEELDKKGSLQ
jgi:hypothetical protein